jgi:hypothetical protein
VKKVLMNQLEKDHVLNGLRVKKWLPVISSPEVLNEPDKAKASQIEADLVAR